MTHADLALHSAGMTTRRWIEEVPPSRVRVADLTPIQEAPTSERLAAITAGVYEARRSASADPITHVVAVGSGLYIEDGHHRYYLARAARRTFMLARVLRPPA